uniref:Ribosomal protein S4 n=1 Tax=Cafeteria roenbergensis TaxID=33653 RepID=Q9TAI3_CAFRO|nr:ribosomal protein S4 [Cafeteria roenbergensis]AAF05803.1 ribosomal protein S4 [Cafeteria roenbergensis]
MRKNWYKPHLKIVYNVQDKTFVSRLNRLRFFHDRRVLRFLRWHKGDKGRKVRGIHSLKWYKMRYIFGLKFFNFSSKKRRKVRFYLQKNLYKVELYRKKGFLSFYRKLDDSKIRNWFKHQYNKSRQFKIINFFKMFETRLDVISFRMKLTPTIFLANMFIKTRGLQINYGLKKEPSYRLQIGDLISFESDTLWHFFASRFHNQLWKRWHRLIDLNKQRKTTRLLTFREYNKKSSLHIQDDRSLILNENFKNLENTWTFFINKKQIQKKINKSENFNELQEILLDSDKKTLTNFAINQVLISFSLEKRSRLLTDYKLLLKEFVFSKNKIKLKKKKFFFFLVKNYIKNFFNSVLKEQNKLKHLVFFYKNFFKTNLKKNLLNNMLNKNFSLFFFKEKNTLGLIKIFIWNALNNFSLINQKSVSFFLKKVNSKKEQNLKSRINYYTSRIENLNNFSSNLFFKRKNFNSLLENSFINLENFKWLDTWSQQILIFFNFNFQLKALLQRIFVSFIIRNETYRFFFLKFWLIYRSFLTRFAKLFLPLKKFFQYLTLLKHICKSTNEKILSSSFYKGLYLRFFIQKFELISNFVSLIENQKFNFNQFFILLKNFLNPIIFMNNVNYLKKHFLLTRLPFETFTEEYNQDLQLVFEHVVEENFFDILADWVLYTNKHNIHFTIFWNHYCDEQKVVLIVYLKTALELKYDWKELFFKNPLKMDLTHIKILQPFCRGLHQEFYIESTFLLKDCFAMEQYSLLPKIKFTDFYLDNDLENKIMTSFLVAQQNAGLNEAEDPLTESEEEDEEEEKKKKAEENNQVVEIEQLQSSDEEEEYLILNTSEEERLQRAFIYEEEEKDLGIYELSETSETEYEHPFLENEFLNTSTLNWKKKQLFNINRAKFITTVTKNIVKSSLIKRKLEKKIFETIESPFLNSNLNYVSNQSNGVLLVKNFDIKNNLKIFLKTIPFTTSFLSYKNSSIKESKEKVNLRSKTYKKFILKEQKIWKRFRRLKRRRRFQFLRGHKKRRRYTFSRLLKKVKFVKNQKIQVKRKVNVKKLTNFLLKRNFIRNLSSFKLNSWRRKRGKNFFNLVNFNENIQKNLHLPIRRIYFKKRYLISKKTKRKKKFLIRSINLKTNSFWRNLIKLILLNNNKKRIKSKLAKNLFFIKQSFIILRALQNLRKKNSSFNFKFQRTLNKKRTKKRLYFFLSTPRFRKQILKQYRKDKKFIKSHKNSTIINKKIFFSRWKWKTHYKQPRNWVYLNTTLRHRKNLNINSQSKQNILTQLNTSSKTKLKKKKKIKFSSFSFWRKKKKKKAKAWVSNRKSNRRSSNRYLKTVRRRFRFLPTQFSFYKFNFFKRKKSYKRFRGVKQWWRRTARPKRKEYRVASLKRYNQKTFKNVVAFSLDADIKKTTLTNVLWNSQQILALKLKFLNALKMESQMDSSFLLYQQFYNLQAFIPNYGWNFDQKVNDVQEMENENWFTTQENNTRNEIFYTMYKKNKVLKSFDKLLLKKSVKIKPRRKHSLMMRSNFFNLKKKVNNFKNLQKNLSFNITEDKLRRYKKYIWYHQKWMRRSSVRKRYKFRTKLLQLNKIRRLKKKKFLNIKTKPSLFLPHFLEYDFVTFRGVMISFPKVEASVFGGASNSYFYGLINYYQRLGL